MTLSLFDRPEPAGWLDDIFPEEDIDGLRYYQREARGRIDACLKKERSTLVVMATGTGKTEVFGSVVKHSRVPVLVLAHRDELVDQARRRVERMTGRMVEMEQGEWTSSLRAPIVVGSVQSFNEKRLERLGKARFGLIVTDECFPAGTMIAGRYGDIPIERVAEGDQVHSVDHGTGQVCLRRVKRVASKSAPSLRRLTIRATVVTCTPNHPIFVKGIGYVEAGSVVAGDVLCLRKTVHRSSEEEDVLSEVSVYDLFGSYGTDKPVVRFDAHEGEESDEAPGGSSEDAEYASRNGPSAGSARRERRGGHGRGACGLESIGVAMPRDRSHAYVQDAGRVSESLQDGRGQRGAESCDRGGRPQSLRYVADGARQEERRFFAWARVDRVESVQSASSYGTVVYNFEVEGSHTYFANGILVHNCHHFLAPTYRRVLDWFSDAKVLGVTATPDRGDELALGQIFDSVAYVFDIEDGIKSGYLVPIRGRQIVLADIQLDNVATNGSHKKGTKDFLIAQLDEEMVKVVGAVVAEVLRLEPDRQGICFFPGIRSAELACHRFNALVPGSACFLSGATEPMERRRIVADFRAGKYRYLCNCQIATEGFDCPPVSLIVQARPTLSRALYAQMIGRGMRTLPALVDAWPLADQASIRRDVIAKSAKPDCMVLDFVGNSSKHSLVGLEDMLGGNYSEAEVKEAKKKMGDGSRDPQSALIEARRQLAEAAARSVRVKAAVRDFDPFHVFALSDENRYATRFGEKKASEAQVSILRKLGVPEEELDGLSKTAAGKLLTVCSERRKKALCTYRQLRQLKRFGVTDTNIPFDRASDALTYIAGQHWKNVDPHRLNEILFHARNAGED